jgi:hypothetical protein
MTSLTRQYRETIRHSKISILASAARSFRRFLTSCNNAALLLSAIPACRASRPLSLSIVVGSVISLLYHVEPFLQDGGRHSVSSCAERAGIIGILTNLLANVGLPDNSTPATASIL